MYIVYIKGCSVVDATHVSCLLSVDSIKPTSVVLC